MGNKMFLSNLIVKWLEWIIEIGLWALLVGFFTYGFTIGDGFFGSIFLGLFSLLLGSIFLGLFSLLLGSIFSALTVGVFLVLNDIRRTLNDAVARNDVEGALSDAPD